MLARLAMVAGLLGLIVLRGQPILKARTLPSRQVPASWPAPSYDFQDNPITAAGFALGRKLFYDASLSHDGSVSCGSCHQQFAAFAQLDHRVSHGIGGLNGKRNAPGLFNLAWQPQLMWDGAATHLETQPILPISNPLEMGESLADVVARLKMDPGYPRLFAAAFGTAEIDSQRVLRALAQFTGSLVSSHSRYDGYIAGEEKFSPEEVAGLALFRRQCAACHREPLFSDYSYRSNGLDAIPVDEGRAGVTARPEDRGLFRVPSLRNVALTPPYMHDGRYDSLEQVLDHYDHGIVASPALDPLLSKGIALNPQQRRELLSFLNTLSDTQFISDVRFSDPDATRAVEPSLASTVAAWFNRAGWTDADVDEIHRPTPAGSGPLADPKRQARPALQTTHVELVLAHEAQDLVVYADDAVTNAPLRGLNLSARIGDQLLKAVEVHEGDYRIPAEHIDFARPQALELGLRGDSFDEHVREILPAETQSAQPPTARHFRLRMSFAMILSLLAAMVWVTYRKYRDGLRS